MSTKQRRIRFSPCVTGPAGRDADNQTFREQAHAHNLRWQCHDCAYWRPSDRQCSVGWPNDALDQQGAAAIDDADVPIFCKAFEDVLA